MSDKLTAEQIKHWRLILVQMFGAYALIMTDAQVQAYKDRMQERIHHAQDSIDTDSDDAAPQSAT